MSVLKFGMPRREMHRCFQLGCSSLAELVVHGSQTAAVVEGSGTVTEKVDVLTCNEHLADVQRRPQFRTDRVERLVVAGEMNEDPEKGDPRPATRPSKK